MKDTDKCSRCDKVYAPDKLRWRSDPDIWAKPPAPAQWREGRYCEACFDRVDSDLVTYFQAHPPVIKSS